MFKRFGEYHCSPIHCDIEISARPETGKMIHRYLYLFQQCRARFCVAFYCFYSAFPFPEQKNYMPVIQCSQYFRRVLSTYK